MLRSSIPAKPFQRRVYQVLKFLDFGFRSKLALGHSQEGLKFVPLVAGMCIHGSQKNSGIDPQIAIMI